MSAEGGRMLLRDTVEHIFGYGYDGAERVLNYFLEKELAGCRDDIERWHSLYAKCAQWRKEFLLWEAQSYIFGVHGWNLDLDVCRLRLPEGTVEWMSYLYRMAMARVINSIAPEDREWIAQAGQNNNLTDGCWTNDFIEQSGYESLTREQWLTEVTGLLEQSWAKYQRFDKSGAPDYAEAMRENYPRFRAALEYLEQNVGECEIARMNRHERGETVWYFVLAGEEIYLMKVSDKY